MREPKFKKGDLVGHILIGEGIKLKVLKPCYTEDHSGCTHGVAIPLDGECMSKSVFRGAYKCLIYNKDTWEFQKMEVDEEDVYSAELDDWGATFRRLEKKKLEKYI